MPFLLKSSINIFIALLCCLCVPSTSSAQKLNQLDRASISHTEATLFNTEQKVFASKIMNQQFKILISLPYSYYSTNKDYPVFFNLDANISFGLTDNVAHILFLNKKISELIIIGIAYDIKGIEDWATSRWRDFKPTSQPKKDKVWQDRLPKATGRTDIVVTSGGTQKFLNFIIKEVIPFVEDNYRVSKSDRGIGGISAAGLFTLYTLFQQPDVFQRYFAGSPSINWDENYMYQLEQIFADTHNDLPARIFMCVGGLESESYISNMNKMSKLLRSRNYPNLVIESVVFDNESHASIASASISRALEMLYLD